MAYLFGPVNNTNLFLKISDLYLAHYDITSFFWTSYVKIQNWSSQVQSKTNGCICNIKVIISLFFDDTTFRVYAHYEFQCLSFFMRCSSSSYSNLCVGFHVNLFNVCEKIARPHTRTRCGTQAHTPARGAKRTSARTHFFFLCVVMKRVRFR